MADEILGRFRAAYPVDLLEQHLCGDEWERMKRLGPPGPMEVHHIWRVGKRKHLWGNLIPASRRAHNYCHKHTVPGHIAAMYARLTLGDDRYEILDDWREAAGCLPLGWIEAKVTSGAVPECYLDTVAAIFEMF